ncbi:MAG: tyrosine-type recombinase/integrase [Actinomycetes bacterium]|jgi:integrase
MASIQQRSNGRWAVRWRDEHGDQRWQTFATKADARTHLLTVELGLVTPHDVRPIRDIQVPTMSQYVETWASRQLWRPSTRLQVECYMRRHILPSFGERRLTDITPADVQLWVRRLSEGLSPASVRVISAHLRSVMNEAVRDGLLVTSPARHVRLPQRCDAPRRPPTVDQVRRLRDALPERHRAIVTVLAGTGLRQGEVLGLTLDRLDRTELTIHVDRLLAQPPATGLFAPTKTRASMRSLPVTAQLLQAIDEHVDRFGVGEEGLVFTDDDGSRLLRRTVSSAWAPAARAAGLPARSGMHCLRHFYASLLIRSGCSVKVVQARLGHSTAKETLDTYAHLWPDDEDRTREAVRSSGV